MSLNSIFLISLNMTSISEPPTAEQERIPIRTDGWHKYSMVQNGSNRTTVVGCFIHRLLVATNFAVSGYLMLNQTRFAEVESLNG